jgi:hypothetical protein
MSLPELFELVVEVAVLAVCCDCVNGTGDTVIEFVLELTNMLLLLLTTIDEELCITCVDCELLSDVPVSYPAKNVRSEASVQKNDTAPSSV